MENPDPAASGRPRLLLRWLVVATAYYATGRLGLAVPYVGTHITLIWPPTGIALAALLLWGPRMWPAVFAGALAVNLGISASAALAAGIACGNTAGPALGAWLLRRGGFDPAFERRADVLRYVALGVLLAMLVNASNGVIQLWLHGLLPASALSRAWFYWWCGDAVGALVCGVPLLALSARPPWRRMPGEMVEGTIGLLLLGWTGWALFMSDLPWLRDLTLPLVFLPFLGLIWVALRSGVAIAALGGLLLSAFAAVGTALGRGPFAVPDTHQSLLMLWTYIATLAVAKLMLVALTAELAASEARLRMIGNGLRDLVFQHDREGRYMVVLDTCEPLLGYRADELLGRVRYQFMHPEDADRCRAAVEAMIETRLPSPPVEYRYRHADGRWIWLQGLSTLVTDAAGSVVAIQVTARDVSARKATEAALMRSEAVNRGVVDALHEGVLVLHGDGAIVSANPRAAELLGFDADAPPPDIAELLNQRELLHADGRPREFAPGTLQGFGRFPAFNRRVVGLRLPGAAPIWLDVNGEPIPLAGESESGYVLSFADITGQREHQHAIERMASRLALASAAAGLGLWSVDAASGRVEWDERVREQHGLAAGAPVPDLDDWLARFQLESAPLARRLLVERRPPREPVVLRLRLPDGGSAEIEFSAHVERDAEGEPARVVGFSRDVTQRELATRLRHERDLAYREMRTRNEFLARMSHELRTPLNAVLGFAQLIPVQEGDELTPRARRNLGHIVEAGHHQLRLINDLLELARTAREEFAVENTELALAPLMLRLRPLVEAALAERSNRLVIDCPEALRLRGDEQRLMQVLLNLVTNAGKFSPHGSAVELKCEQADGKVSIAVCDRGPGIPPDALDRIFEPFVGRGAGAPSEGGMGLGLSLSRALATAMGGSLVAANRPEGGARFTLTLPAAMG
ncbi:MASE1 domain-containing protein [Derxia gummosa]|uniref:histidine kinase n=1 Tax=Derxia gummosa DSM 723 TaxID=1121388 RepID=A0A8B6X9Q3_9BURK|nr:MASE1 domain-containing protein [Derxia gummosa]